MKTLGNYSVEILRGCDGCEEVFIDGDQYVPLPHESTYKIRMHNNADTRCDAYVYIDDRQMGIWRMDAHHTATIERPSNEARKFTFLKEGSSEAESVGIQTCKSSNGLIKVVFKPEKPFRCAPWNPIDSHTCMCGEHVHCGCRTGLYGRPLGINTVGSSLKNSNFDLNYSDSFSRSFGNESQNESLNAWFGDATASPALNIQNSHLINANTSMNYSANSFSAGATALGDRSDQRFRDVSAITCVDHSKITTIYIRLIVNDEGVAEIRPKYKALGDSFSRATSVPKPLSS